MFISLMREGFWKICFLFNRYVLDVKPLGPLDASEACLIGRHEDCIFEQSKSFHCLCPCHKTDS